MAVYKLPIGTSVLPDFEKLSAVSDVYTETLNVKPRDYTTSLWSVIPGTEWFAIDYSGRFWIENPGEYRFFLQSDDGSRLSIDDVVIIDDDGVHPPTSIRGSAVELTQGMHRMRVSYFQGPSPGIALVLAVQAPGNKVELFDTRKFQAPQSLSPSLTERNAVTPGEQHQVRPVPQLDGKLNPKWALEAALESLSNGAQTQSVKMLGLASREDGSARFTLKAHRFSRIDKSSVEMASPRWLFNEVRDDAIERGDPELPLATDKTKAEADAQTAAEADIDWFFPLFLLDRMLTDPAISVLRTTQDDLVLHVVAHRRGLNEGDEHAYLSGNAVLGEVTLDFNLSKLELVKYTYCANALKLPCLRVVVSYSDYGLVNGMTTPMHLEKRVLGKLVLSLSVKSAELENTTAH